MSEYHYIMSLYNKHKQYHRKVILFSSVLLIVASLFVAIDIVRVSPLFIYSIAMIGALYYAKKIRVESKQYGNVENFLRKHAPDLIDNEEFFFFLDYQIASYFEKESDEWFKDLNDGEFWNDERAIEGLMKIITEVKGYYDYLAIDTSKEENMALSLDWYRESFENRKKDIV